MGDQGGKWRGARGPQAVLLDLASTRNRLRLGPWEELRTTITNNTARARPERGDLPQDAAEKFGPASLLPSF